MRLQEITTEILRQLAAWDSPADEAVLHQQLNNRFSPEVTYVELGESLTLLHRNRFINRFDNIKGPRWSITDKGRAELHA